MEKPARGMTLDEVRELLTTGGPEVVVRGGVSPKDDFLRLVTGLANSGGGTIIIGPDEETRELRGVNHPGVALEHVRIWLNELPRVPVVEGEMVDMDPGGVGRRVVVVHVAPESGAPYAVDGVVLEWTPENRLVPISGTRAKAMALGAPTVETIGELADLIVIQSASVSRLHERLEWRRQLPLQVALVIGGAIVGYLLGLWNPLS